MSAMMELVVHCGGKGSGRPGPCPGSGKKGAMAGVAKTKKTDVGAELKKLSDAGVAGSVKRKKGIETFMPKMSDKVFHKSLKGHMESLKKLRKADVAKIAKGHAASSGKTKKAMIEAIERSILERRNSNMRSYI